LGIVTTTSETAFTQSAETVYDFVTNPENWTKTYPGSAHIGNLPELPLKVGDTWEESGPDGDRIFSWQLAVAVRPSLFGSARLVAWAMTAMATAAWRAGSPCRTGSPGLGRTSRCSPGP
jgi:hypothetical protein